MSSIKVKFRPSTTVHKEGTIYYQIIQNRVIRQLKTDYRLFMHKWNEEENSIIITNIFIPQAHPSAPCRVERPLVLRGCRIHTFCGEHV